MLNLPLFRLEYLVKRVLVSLGRQTLLILLPFQEVRDVVQIEARYFAERVGPRAEIKQLPLCFGVRQIQSLERIDAHLTVGLRLEASEGVQVLADDHCTRVGTLLNHVWQIEPLAFVDVELAHFVCRDRIPDIASNHIDGPIVEVACKRGPCHRYLLA